MISLPNAIVIYPQKKSDPSYLLCWIPVREYQRVVLKPEKRAELEKLYPQGIEIELTEDSLKEAGIALEVTPQQLQRAYLDLLALNLLPGTGMVELASLNDYLVHEQDTPLEELAFSSTVRGGTVDGLAEGDLLRKITAVPPMTEGDEAGQVYRRLDVKQQQSNQGNKGG